VKSQFITISNFESRIEEALLYRGYEYIDNVLDLKSAENEEYDQWKAKVQGSEVYRVTIQVERSSGVIRFNSCNCPFDGPICKHQIAVLYTIQIEDDGKSRRLKVKPDKVNDVLSQLTLDELRQYIKELTEEDEDSKKHFLSAFATKTCKTVEDFKGIVEQALRPLKRAHGFVHPQEFFRTMTPVKKLIENAERCVHNGDFETGINVYVATLEKLIPALDTIDDSSGILGDMISQVFLLLKLLREYEPPQSIISGLVKYAIKRSTSANLRGSDFQGAEPARDLGAEPACADDEHRALVEFPWQGARRRKDALVPLPPRPHGRSQVKAAQEVQHAAEYVFGDAGAVEPCGVRQKHIAGPHLVEEQCGHASRARLDPAELVPGEKQWARHPKAHVDLRVDDRLHRLITRRL
jgi:hypothetical protein